MARRVERWQGGRHAVVEDHIAEETPVALVYNDVPFTVMMVTPADLVDFAIGFSISEGIVASASEARVAGVDERLEGIEVRLRIPPARARALEDRRRSMVGRSGCGICGSEQLEAVLRAPAVVRGEPRVPVASLHAALRGLHEAQAINALTGATHAAGWASVEGRLHLAREDVGRHNALDKLVGAMSTANLRPADGFLVVTSRASYEMAMKAASAGIALMAAISAPTALAISLAEQAGLTLVGFARNDGHSVYTHPRRLVADGVARDATHIDGSPA